MSKLISKDIIETSKNVINEESYDEPTNFNNAYDNPTADIDISNYDNLLIENSSKTFIQYVPFYDYDNYEYFAVDLIKKDLNILRLEKRPISNNNDDIAPTKTNFLSIGKSIINQDQSVSHIIYDSLLSNDSNLKKMLDVDLEDNLKSNSEPSFIVYDEDIFEND
jgi:hypothetical protein